MLVEPTQAVAAVHDAVHSPRGAWRWRQEWRDVLFVHWRVPAESLRRHLPADLALDLWEGDAYVSAIAFRLKVRMRGLPALWPVSNLLELNLRTYVRCRDERGIFFLSMHADNRLAMTVARCLTPLPYAEAQITYGRVRQASLRAPTHQRTLRVRTRTQVLSDFRFQPHGECHEAAANSLDAWLLERYRAFVPGHNGKLYRMAVEHPSWELQKATMAVTAPHLGMPWGLDLNCEPDLCHYSPGLAARLWPFELVE